MNSASRERNIATLTGHRKAAARITVLVSGGGTNLQAIIDRISLGDINGVIAGVISNVPDVRALERARQADIPAWVIDHRDYPSREAFDCVVVDRITALDTDVVVLAGFMRIFSNAFFEAWRGPLLNIHPALLPDYPGLNTHARAIADSAKWHGASVHFVIPELDAGPVIIRGAVPVLESDTPDTLADRVHGVEYEIYPRALQWLCAGRLSVVDGAVLLDNARHPDQGLDAPGH